MRNLFLFFLLFSGVILVSCEESNTEDSTIIKPELNDSDADEINPESDEIEVEKPAEENAKMIWKKYNNDRFGFCVEYPSNFLTAMGESENEDGNTFANANRSSEMNASGIENVLEESIAKAFETATKNGIYYSDERRILYKRQNENWFVVSGKYYESLFYARTVLKNGIFYTLYFEYHPSEEKKFKEIIEYTTKNFPKC